MFFDDFTQDNIGDFPVLWNTNGSGEIVTTNLFPGRWLKLGANADLAKALAPGLKYNVLRFEIGGEAQNLISNFRVAVGAPDMRNKLITEGKLVTYGIYFDSGSDKIKPESSGTMKEIATVLKENPTVKIKIIGHTDSDGDDAKNLDLSKRRSISVKNALSTEYGIEALRIETDGKGETEPIAPNSTSEGKAKNRRVELIKL